MQVPHFARSAASVALFLAATFVPAAAQDYEGQIRGLMADPAVQAALDHIEATDEQTMADLRTLTEIPAPPFMEEARAARYGELLREAGADSVWIDEEGNVLALRRGRQGGRTVALGGHLDTVFPEGTDVAVRVRGDTLYAPGVGDDTRGLVVVLTVLRALEEALLDFPGCAVVIWPMSSAAVTSGALVGPS